MFTTTTRNEAANMDESAVMVLDITTGEFISRNRITPTLWIIVADYGTSFEARNISTNRTTVFGASFDYTV